MATFIHYLQGGANTTIDASDYLAFSDGTFGNAITVNAYNGGTHVRSSAGVDDSSANTPNNVTFISQTGGTAGDSQADWGDGTEDLDQILNSEATLKINFSHGSSVTTSNAKFYAYDGTTPATAPTNLDFYAAEVGDTNWTNADGSGAALTLNNNTTATSHDFYIAVSVKPTAVGENSANKYRIELTYS
jgi:hypothetical protein